MAQTFIPGWLASVEIMAIDLSVIGQVIGYSDDHTALPKPVFGQSYRNTVRGQGVVSFDCSGHLSAETVADLFGINAADIAVDFSVQIGELGGDTDGGIMSGTGVITNLSIDDDATGNWAWSLTLESDGAPLYTPAVP